MNPSAERVYRSLDSKTYDTEEQALAASKIHLVRKKAMELLAPDTCSTWNSPRKDRDRSRVAWFIDNKDKILDAYATAVLYAEEKMQCSTNTKD